MYSHSANTRLQHCMCKLPLCSVYMNLYYKSKYGNVSFISGGNTHQALGHLSTGTVTNVAQYLG